MSTKNGVMLIGLCGHLSTTTVAGAIALSNKMCPPTGLISELEAFNHIAFTDFKNLVFGGWDIRSCSQSVNALKDIGLDNMDQLIELSQEVAAIHSEAFPGILLNAGEAISSLSEKEHVFYADSIVSAIEKIGHDIDQFKSRHHLDTVTVINVSSTEPAIRNLDAHADLKSLQQIIDENAVHNIRPSLVYAYAAITHGCAYINFTPSEGGFSNGLIELAEKYRVPVMGSDGKTGETLVKSALAPMFAMRNLEVLSWEGYNILGNLDGKVLDNEDNGSTKIKSKDRLLPYILGYHPHSKVTIDYVPSLGDRKTAWDFIHFQGFLNTKMSLQFTWQGCDSALASPLILDLARFGMLALERGESGVMSHLASFFKSPWGIEEHVLGKQFDLLETYCSNL